jgi:hypothetical protein
MTDRELELCLDGDLSYITKLVREYRNLSALLNTDKLQCWDAEDPEAGCFDPTGLAEQLAEKMQAERDHALTQYEAQKSEAEHLRAELELLLLLVVEAARGVLRYDGIDKTKQRSYMDRLDATIQTFLNTEVP